MTLSLMKHQEVGLDFLRGRRAAGIFFEQGCIDGEAIIHCNRARKSFKIKLKDLYHKFNGGKCGKHEHYWDLSFDTYARSLKGQFFGLNKIIDVLYKGKKETLEIELDSGKKIKLTPDHEVAIGVDKWQRAEKLEIGDTILTNGKKIDVRGKHVHHLKGKCNPKWKGGSFKDKDGYVIESGHPAHPRASNGQVYQHLLVMEKKLGRFVTKDEIVHHVNEIKDDNRIENLKLLSKKEHLVEHKCFTHLHGGKTINGGKVVIIPKEDKVVSIKKSGLIDVYDIVMEDPYRNFVANKIVMHNCSKTLILLEHLDRLFKEGNNPFPCLVVSPLSGVGVWENEVKKFGYNFTVGKLVGGYKKRVENLNQQKDIYLINFEGMRILEKHLASKQFKTILYDESHRICNRGTQQTKVALELSQRIPNRYILTGTPITKSPEDIWAQFQIIAPGYLGNFYAFQAKHVEFKKVNIRVKGGGYREIRKPTRFRYLKELNQQLEQHAIRRTKDECLDLPEKIYKLIPCPLSPAQLKHYHGLKHSLATMIDGEQLRLSAVVAVMQKLQQVCQGFIYTDDKTAVFDSGKQKIFFDLMEDLRNEHVVVFTWFQYDVRLLVDKLKAEGFNVVEYDGNYEERKAIVDKFQNSKEPMVFVSNVERAKESITLTAASHVVYYGQSWNYATRVQSEDRMHRIGQRKPVIYYDLVVPNTIDELIFDSIKYKGDIADKITGDASRLAKMVLEQQEG